MNWIRTCEELPTQEKSYWVVLENINGHHEVDLWTWCPSKQDWYLYNEHDGYYFLSEPQPYCDLRYYVDCKITYWMEKFKPNLPEELS